MSHFSGFQFDNFEPVYLSDFFFNIIIHFGINIFIIIINPTKTTGNATLPVLYLGYYENTCLILSPKEGNQVPEI
jgi:hypothetical protein